MKLKFGMPEVLVLFSLFMYTQSYWFSVIAFVLGTLGRMFDYLITWSLEQKQAEAMSSEINNAAAAIKNIFSMAEIAMANNIAVYICSTLPAIDFLWSPGLEPATKIVKLNSILKSYCEENGLTYVDYYSAMVDADGGLKVPEYTAANDLSHPNLEGYKVMEEIILASLKK